MKSTSNMIWEGSSHLIDENTYIFSLAHRNLYNHPLVLTANYDRDHKSVDITAMCREETLLTSLDSVFSASLFFNKVNEKDKAYLLFGKFLKGDRSELPRIRTITSYRNLIFANREAFNEIIDVLNASKELQSHVERLMTHNKIK